MKSQIHLIRHGITEGNLKRWYYGSSDSPLAAEGVDALAELAGAGIYPPADETENRAAADLYTSGLLRTEQTLFLIYGIREHRVLAELQEMHFGEYEGKTHQELEAEAPYQTWVSDKTGGLAPPGGESPLEFRSRIAGGFQTLLGNHRLKELSLRHQGREAHSILVCHGGVISAIMMEQFPGEEKNLYQWIPDPGHGYTITLEDSQAAGYLAF